MQNNSKEVVYTVLTKFKCSVYGNTLKLLFHNSSSLLIGQGIILLLYMLLLVPLMTFGFNTALGFAGFSYVTFSNLGRFLLNPLSILTLFALLYLTSLFVLLEVYFLTAYFSIQEGEKQVKIHQILAASVYKVITGIYKGNLRLITMAWVTLVAFNLPLIFFLFRKNRFIRYVSVDIPDAWIFLVIGIVFILFLGLLHYRKSFIFHYYLIRKSPYAEAVKQAHATKLNHPYQTLFYYLGWNVVQAVVLGLFYIVVVSITMMIVSSSMDRRLAVAAFITLNEKLENYLSIFMFLFSTISQFALYTHLFYHYKLAPVAFTIEEVRVKSKVLRKTSYKRMAITMLIILVAIDLYFFINIRRNGSVLNTISFDAIQITSHRGSSYDVPENTIPAIERAIDEQSDYVEVDVRATKDLELVLLHDSSLKRTTGVSKYIWDVTYDEIKDLDAGSWMNEEFTSVKIPTLREVLELSKGKAVLNLDLKYVRGQVDVVERLIDLIHEYEMEWQCVITSTSLDYLKKIKTIDPNIQTGYITYQINSKVAKSDFIDVFSMKSSLVTKSVIAEIHQNGKKIFVWTVNTRKEMERLSRIGVDNIVTDHPIYAREVLYQSSTDWYIVTLLKIIFE